MKRTPTETKRNYIIFLTSNLFSTMKWNERVALTLSQTQAHNRQHHFEIASDSSLIWETTAVTAATAAGQPRKIGHRESSAATVRDTNKHTRAGHSPNGTNERNRKHELKIKRKIVFFPSRAEDGKGTNEWREKVNEMSAVWKLISSVRCEVFSCFVFDFSFSFIYILFAFRGC